MESSVTASRDATRSEWRNWSGHQGADPDAFAQPETLEALRDGVVNARRLRVVGAGHSFTPLVPTGGTLINLDRMGGVRSVDPESQSAWVGAGSRLRDLSPAFHEQGLAFPNLGDIDVQSLAGAIGTATHGTGRELPCLSAAITGVRLLTAGGEDLEWTRERDPERLQAAQVSLGALGVIHELRVALRPNYRLHRRTWAERLDSIIADAAARWERHRNFEFFYIPFSGWGMCIAHDETTAAPTERAPSTDDEDLMKAKRLRDLTRWCTPLRRAILSRVVRGVTPEDVVGDSWRLLASERNVRFNEMEYHLPPENAVDALREVIDVVERERRDVFFPIEVRQTAGDDAWLSPFNGGRRISIAVHTHARDEDDWLFRRVEPIFRRAGGRPHWGKLHSLGAPELAELYPEFERFLALRRELDPTNKLVNAHTARLWGEPHHG
ncbi:oxidoreductase [Halovibrio salipaludis]|uniref:Oxidoreductase n=1 Tax=Halovibrio salipaludis TaxID=2032626 RepID=A0A2A2FAG0_9GAMM|nr:D-arabinono-1,4-lactone oxidase [Halovibrio salipaludis]PAU81830.1 oxidoreductase [Halovibrio salipaludis]